MGLPLESLLLLEYILKEHKIKAGGYNMWTIDDVEKHKAGLSEKQKRQWVRLANATLAKCIKKGGTEETCTPKAIQQANGVINTNSHYSVHTLKQDGAYDAELLIHQGSPYYKIPVVMMVEGVLHGSRGPLLHALEEFGKIPDSWNGIPIVIDHPEDDEGIPVSANSPEIIDTKTVGRIYHTNVDGLKLKSEAWLDEQKLNDISPDILKDIIENKVLEVSVGVFTDEIEEEGEYNGKQYIGVATNHRPDHLAILTACVGACSCKDGCGLGANENKESKQEDLSEGGTLIPAENPVDVVNFNISINKKEVKMANECAPCIKLKVDALIANNQGRWKEDDREFLQTLTEAQLDKMAPIETVVEKKIEVNRLTPQQEADLVFVANMRAEKKRKLISEIQANTEKDVWSEDSLGRMDDDTLDRVHRSVRKAEAIVDYSVTGGSPQVNAGVPEPMLPIGVEFDKK